MADIVIEAAVDNLPDARRAVREGANRLEICHDLDAGGLTPSPRLLRSCLALGVPCVAMARPRPGDFIYNDREFEELCESVSDAAAAGAHGIAFGCLEEGGTVAPTDVRTVVRLADTAETVFHRAFDHTIDAMEALEVLVRCRVTRVLTSGHAGSAAEGAETLADLVKHANGRIGIVAGGSVRRDNVRVMVERTGVVQVHARASTAGVIAGIRGALGMLEEQNGVREVRRKRSS